MVNLTVFYEEFNASVVRVVEYRRCGGNKLLRKFGNILPVNDVSNTVSRTYLQKPFRRKTSSSVIGPSSALQNTKECQTASHYAIACVRLPSFAFACLRLPSLVVACLCAIILHHTFPSLPPSRLIISYYFRFRCYCLKGKDYPIKCPSQKWSLLM